MKVFNVEIFEQKLFQLKDAHDCISSLSNWCLSNEQHSAKIISTWLNVLKKMNTEQRLLMFYLANDIIQYSKRKNLPFVDGFAPALQKGTTMVRDESIRNKILRLFKIWDDRHIYDESFLVDLSGLLTHGFKNTRKTDIEDYQPSLLYSRLKSCKSLENDTIHKLNVLNQNEISVNDVEKLRNTLKDRKASEEVVGDIDEGINKMKGYIDALEIEIKERRGLVDLLEVGEQFYEKEHSEARVVTNAYKCFTSRVKGLKRKLESRIEELAPAETENQTNQDETSSQSLSVNFYSGESFMNQSVNFNSYFSDPNQNQQTSTSEVTGMEYSPDSTVDESKRSPIAKMYSPTEPAIDKIKTPVVSDAVQEPTADNDAKKYPSLDERLAFHNFSGQPSFMHFADPSTAEPVYQNNQGIVKAKGFDSEVTSSINKSVAKVVSQDLDETPNEYLNTSSSLVIDWKSSSEPDWESPESPPTFEKFGFPDSKEDVDIRPKDIDHRNLINLTNEQTTEAWSPNSNYVGELSPVSVDDNVENVDMDLSDEDDKKSSQDEDDGDDDDDDKAFSSHLHRKNDENCACDVCTGDKKANEATNVTHSNKGYYTSTVSEHRTNDSNSKYQITSNNYLCDTDLRQGNPPNYYSSTIENINYFLPPPPPPPPLPAVKDDLLYGSETKQLMSPPPPPLPPTMNPMSSFSHSGSLVPPPLPPMQITSTDYNKSQSSSNRYPPAPPSFYNSYSPILSSDFRTPASPQTNLKNVNISNPNIIASISSNSPGNIRFAQSPSLRLQNPGFLSSANNTRLQNPSVPLQVPNQVIINPRHLRLLNPY